MEKRQLTQYKIITITAVLVVLACSFAIYLRLFTEKELWYEMFAAVLGVIITAIITMILLRGQSDNDVERERASKIFGEKLKIYQEYLSTLCDVIKDRKLTDEEKIRLEFQTSYVAMHCNPAYIVKISEAVRDLIKYCCPDESNEGPKRINPNLSMSDSPDPLLNSLFCIVEAFRKDLYGDNFKFKYDDTLDAFGVHGVGGIIGSILTGVFATQFITGEGGVKGALYGDWHQLGVQLVATLISIVFSAVMTYLLFKLTDRLVGIRVDKRVEEEGLDIYEHGESAYNS